MSISRSVPIWILLCAFLVGLPSGTANAQTDESEAIQLLSLINEHRSESDVCWDGERWLPWPARSERMLLRSPTLSVAAQRHNLVMMQSGCFAHACEGEPALPERVEAAGYPAHWTFLAENLAAGFETAAQVFAGWHGSEDHNKNMLTCQARAIGIARTVGEDTQYRWYWTTDFGDVVDESSSETGSDPLLAAIRPYDANANDLLDREEFLRILTDWIEGELGDAVVTRAIDLWVSQQPLSSSGLSGRGGRLRAVEFVLNQSRRALTFTARGQGIEAIVVTVYDLEGHPLFSRASSGTSLTWRLREENGKPVANGVYLYRVTARGPWGEIVHSEVRKLAILR